MPKEIEIVPSDDDVRELWQTQRKLGMLKKNITYREFFKEYKKPIKALFG